jgi:hypothetical protein
MSASRLTPHRLVYGVHTPLQAKKEVIAKYERVAETQRQGKPEYAAMVESIDDSVGRVMTTLKELGLDENTVILFTSDNGGFANTTSNVPLRANKGAYYEGGIRAPLIIKRPGVTKLGLVVNEPVKACWPCGRSSGTTLTTTSILRVSPAVSSGKVHGSSSKPSTPGASNSTTSLTTSAKPKSRQHRNRETGRTPPRTRSLA